MKRFTWELTSTEMEIMEIFWNFDKGISFKDLLGYLNENLNKQWKRQTLTTYLSGLQKLKLITFAGQRKNYIYYATCTKDEYIHRQTRELVELSYDNSLSKFLSAFTGGGKITKKEADSLRKWLEACSSDEEKVSKE